MCRMFVQGYTFVECMYAVALSSVANFGQHAHYFELEASDIDSSAHVSMMVDRQTFFYGDVGLSAHIGCYSILVTIPY